MAWLRLHRLKAAESLSLRDAAELVAVLRLIGFKAARFVFRWDERAEAQAQRLYDHPPVWKASEAYWQANLGEIDEETGLAVLDAMIDGGYKRGVPPEVTLQALRSLRKSGWTTPRIAARFGFGVPRVQNWLNPAKKGGISARLAAQLALTI